MLAILPAYQIAWLQHVQNAVIGLFLDRYPRDHVTAAVQCIHWLTVC